MNQSVTAAKPRMRRLFVAAIILSSCIGCDRATKYMATQSLKGAPAQSLLADTLRFEYALNPGGFLSLGGNLPDAWRQSLFVFCNVCTMLAITGFLVFRRTLDLKLSIALSCILAGGIGNLIDRVSNQGLVTDFINVGIGPLRTGIFNVADMAVLFGSIAVIYLTSGNKNENVVVEVAKD